MQSDDSLIQQVRNGNMEAQEELIRRYKGLVRIKAAAYFLPGGDRDDIIQEGMIGLFKAIRDYDMERGVQFNSFVALCVSRQIISAIKASRRLKHKPLNTSSSFTYEEEGVAGNPEALFIDRESKTDMEQNIRKALSGLEEQVLSLYLRGHRYAEIAQILDKDIKAVDNTIQRVRRKVGKIIQRRAAMY